MLLNEEELLFKLLEAKTSSEVDSLVKNILSEFGERIALVPIGKRENNRGIIEIGKDPGRGIVERVTNGIDAILEIEHLKHGGFPECKTPREAANAWLGIPYHGLYELSAAKRRELAKSVVVTIEEGDNKFYRTIQIVDGGIGISTDQMSLSILSLGETNKLQKLYLVGAFGQGGSSTFASCTYSVIASRLNSDLPHAKRVGFTVVYYQDLPPEMYKHGRYVYLTVDGRLFEAEVPVDKFPKGTIVKHFGYDISSYVGALGPGSVYGLLQHALFDPIIPIFLEDKVHSYRRVIKGSRNALNGAVDEGDERGPVLSHNVPLYYVTLGDFGNIGIEYWLLEQSEKERYPSRAYVDNKRPIILSLNGQSHAELPASLIRNLAELPYLVNRLIIHIDCNNLTPLAKRNLFVSSREDVRKSEVYKIIEDELFKSLKSDDQLRILNEEAKNITLKEKDEEAEKIMRSEVAKILRFYGFQAVEAVGGPIGGIAETEDRTQPVRRPPVHKPTKIIEIHEPPTYVKILVDLPMKFYPEQRRYIRIETDAPSNYHDAEDPKKSRVNIIIAGESIRLSGTTPLKGGRMRIVLDCSKDSVPDSTGRVSIEISRPGLPTLSDIASYLIVEKPEAPPDDKRISVPPIECIPVEGPDDPTWSTLNWPEDVKKVASSSILGADKLTVYYSRAFPNYYNAYKHFECTDTSLAQSFEIRYRIWLAVHSLLIEQDKKQSEDIEKFEETEFEERCRIATIAAMFADREARSGRDLPHVETE
jgi:hypothetical protein